MRASGRLCWPTARIASSRRWRMVLGGLFTLIVFTSRLSATRGEGATYFFNPRNNTMSFVVVDREMASRRPSRDHAKSRTVWSVKCVSCRGGPPSIGCVHRFDRAVSIYAIARPSGVHRSRPIGLTEGQSPTSGNRWAAVGCWRDLCRTSIAAL